MNQKEAPDQMRYQLEATQEDLFCNWLDQSLPEDWQGYEALDPPTPHKTRVTLRIDSDMLRWFRKLGPGYGPRMNRILRIYWVALVSGQIKAYPKDNTLTRLHQTAVRDLEMYMADKAREAGQS